MENVQVYRQWRPDPVYHLSEDKKDLITALAIMLRHFDIEKEEDESLFNPGILNERLNEAGASESGTDLNLRYIDKLYSLDYVGTMAYSRDNLEAALKTGQPFLILANEGTALHYLVPDNMDTDDMAIIDCSGVGKHLSDYDQVLELKVFWRNDQGMMYCVE